MSESNFDPGSIAISLLRTSQRQVHRHMEESRWAVEQCNISGGFEFVNNKFLEDMLNGLEVAESWVRRCVDEHDRKDRDNGT